MFADPVRSNLPHFLCLFPRDLSLLRLLSWTPATTAALLRASETFDGGGFPDERRLRERTQALSEAGFIRSWSTAHAGGGLQNYYKLTPLGFERLYGADSTRPSRAFFSEVSPSLFAHTFDLAEVIIETLRACHARRIRIEQFCRENELTFPVGDDQVQPDCFFRLIASGKSFNLAFEIDSSTEPIHSYAVSSIRHKLSVYNAYQESVLAQWLIGGKAWERPRFRVVFLTQSVQRAYHILTFAAETSPDRAHRLVYATTIDNFLNDESRLTAPIFLDHWGQWQSLVDLHPTAPYLRAPVRLAKPVESVIGVC